MSSNLRIKRICENCSREFVAKTTRTKYCSHKCNSRAYKAKKRAEKVEESEKETTNIKNLPIESIKEKEFLTVKDVAVLINCSTRTIYRLINEGVIKAVNLAQRKTMVKRTEIDKLFEQSKPKEEKAKEQIKFDIEDCYIIKEIHEKYNISEKALYELIKRQKIPKVRKGKYTYIPKKMIDNLLK